MFIVSDTDAMVAYYVTKMVTTCSPMVEQFFDTMIVASSDKEWMKFPASQQEDKRNIRTGEMNGNN